MLDESDKSLPQEKRVIGLVGQVCAGKSAVAEAFRKLGAQVYDADKAVHEIYSRPEVIAEVKMMFGAGVLNEQGGVNRKALAAIVFSDAGKLKELTDHIIFPRTGAEILKAIDAFRKSPPSLLVLDAPALFESHREDLCDTIVYIAAPLERRQTWAVKRGWSAAEIGRRERMMRRDDEKRRRADAMIENDGTLENLERQAGRLVRLWTMQA